MSYIVFSSQCIVLCLHGIPQLVVSLDRGVH